MSDKKFNPQEADKLNAPDRLKYESPELVWNTLKLDNPKVIIDIGTGTGHYAIPFSRKLKGGIVYACDASKEMLDKLQERIAASSADRIIPMLNQEKSIPLENSIADLVFMANLHHEVEDQEEMIRESQRLLKTGGLLAVIDWAPVESPFGPPLRRRIPRQVIAGQFKNAGLLNVRQHQILSYHSFTVGEKG